MLMLLSASNTNIRIIALITLLAPLLGAGLAGLARQPLGRRGAHTVTITGVSIAFIGTLILAKHILLDGMSPYNGMLYTWLDSGHFHFNIGLLLDSMSVSMMLIVTSISLLVHIYSMGYMQEDDGYQRFFCYMSLFTFAMLVLVSANNFLQLFFGWEGVGLVSYLLIGFWFKRESAITGGLKAFLVNRVGDFGFILGMALVLKSVGSLDFATLFSHIHHLSQSTIYLTTHYSVAVPTLIGILLFIGAMGKSAQIPLHVWLPESMEGPTPISALIHAATMVTAGIYMIARLFPIYSLSTVALNMILVVGASGALLMGLVGIVKNDIKRVIAYSTMSQLGYMVAAMGASAPSAGLFHLFTHAFFKALLFLGAGSVIVALHHEQDMRKMGNLRRYMPITYITCLVGSLSLAAVPPFAGFYSKDAIIKAVSLSHLPGAHYAYICLLLGAFVTGLYTFRLFFLTFHSEERLEHPKEVKEAYPSILWPLVVLAIPSLGLGALLVKPILYTSPGLLHLSHANWTSITLHYPGWYKFIGEALGEAPFWLAVSGIGCAWLFYLRFPHWPAIIKKYCRLLHAILDNQYGFDLFYYWFFVRGIRALSHVLYGLADKLIIDHWIINGAGRSVRYLSRRLRSVQSGYLYHYAFSMIVGLTVFLVLTTGWV